jgi:hypothetical protein
MQITRCNVTQPAANPVPDHRGSHRAAHDEADPGRLAGVVPDQQMADEQRAAAAAALPDRGAEIVPVAHPRLCGQHRIAPPPWLRVRSDADAGTALAPACGEHRAAGPGAHAQPEPVRLRATAIVRLERALAHRKLQIRMKVLGQPLSRGYRHDTRLARDVPCVSRRSSGVPAALALPARQRSNRPKPGGRRGRCGRQRLLRRNRDHGTCVMTLAISRTRSPHRA